MGICWANCFKTHNKLTMYPLGKCPFAPSVHVSRSGSRHVIDLLNFAHERTVGFISFASQLGAMQISKGLALLGIHHANMHLGSLRLFRGPPARARFLRLPGGRVGEEIALSRLPWVSTRRLPSDIHPNAFAKGNWPYLGSFHRIF